MMKLHRGPEHRPRGWDDAELEPMPPAQPDVVGDQEFVDVGAGDDDAIKVVMDREVLLESASRRRVNVECVPWRVIDHSNAFDVDVSKSSSFRSVAVSSGPDPTSIARSRGTTRRQCRGCSSQWCHEEKR